MAYAAVLLRFGQRHRHPLLHPSPASGAASLFDSVAHSRLAQPLRPRAALLSLRRPAVLAPTTRCPADLAPPRQPRAPRRARDSVMTSRPRADLGPLRRPRAAPPTTRGPAELGPLWRARAPTPTMCPHAELGTLDRPRAPAAS
ncbi:hypothetical protein GUJ93_ZPchr0012g20079 [Zizania palustris]|uniref:Uncharacterized protein n=1 Tax=Zizania palustris TaxID=103762 RepID=A0A8J5WNL2_ZIZPA|nr:hypothetical protein GUJ93_ZPchr0012g20079 [Zizania palustris]